jgi:hypothetical protein
LSNAKHEKEKTQQKINKLESYLMEGNNHLVHTPKMEEDKSKLQITIGNLHNTYKTPKLKGEKKRKLLLDYRATGNKPKTFARQC